jgi:hypothetical protein
MHRLAVATVDKRWRERTKPRQTDQIFRKRRKTFRRDPLDPGTKPDSA